MSEILARLTAALADRYRVTRELGAGGMATVYLAHDLRHDRDVAIKVLHPDLGAALGADRFLSEIKTTAKLQHPHILPLLDSGAADGLLYYVMPYVRGETLRARLERERQLPVPDAVRIASEVAGALEHAHKQGVIHRDIKPENILLQDGAAVVADFGIALAVQQAGGQRMTQTGLSLGTPQYMSPEQAMGERTVDARSDIYALGAVLYEMLCGEPPFTGPTVQAIVARVMTETPRAITAQRKAVPLHVEGAVLRALEKLPADRLASAAEFADALRGSTGAMAIPAARIAGARQRRTVAGVLTGLSVAMAGGLGWWSGHRTPSADEGASIAFAFRMLGTFNSYRTELGLSRDGQRIALVVTDSLGRRQIAVRELASTKSRFVPGGTGASNAYFSPDGDTLVYVGEDNSLRRLPVNGGTSLQLASGLSPAPVEWATDGYVYFSGLTGLFRVPKGGGNAEELAKIDRARREFALWAPQLLPGGKAVLYYAYAFPADSSRVEILSLADRSHHTVIANAFNPRFVAPGHLLFMRDSALMVIGFDPTTGATRGEPTAVMSDVLWNQTDGLAGFAVSETGTLSYLRASEAVSATRIQWVDRTGRTLEAVTPDGAWNDPRISPDGRTIALTSNTIPRQIWTYDMGRHVLSQLTRSKSAAFSPVWTPDSRSLLHAEESPVYDLMQTDIQTGRTDTILASPYDKLPFSVSSDGRRLAFSQTGLEESILLMDLPHGTPTRLDPTGRGEQAPAFSPDRRWLAYNALANGTPQIFVRALDGSGRRRQVSADGGDQARWSKGGREIVFRRGDDVLAAAFDPQTGEPGSPTRLFSSPASPRLGNGRGLSYDVAADGSRFLLTVAVRRAEALPVEVVTHWTRSLTRADRNEP